MSKIKDALKKLLPEDQINEVSTAVDEMLEDAKAQLETEYNSKLEEAYAELSNDLTEAEKIAEQGYQEAYQIISELRNRLELQGEEYKAALEEGYEEAYKLIKAEREKNNTLEVDMYEEYENKLKEMKEFIVDKVDQFLQTKGADIYETAKRDVLNDPRMAEHKVAFDKIVEITSSYLSDEDYASATSTKLDEVNKNFEDLKGQLKILEARNIRLSTENTKLNEGLRKAQENLLTETKQVVVDKKAEVIKEQNERADKAKNVTGRGTIVSPKKEEEVIISENTDTGEFNELLVLSGQKKSY